MDKDQTVVPNACNTNKEYTVMDKNQTVVPNARNTNVAQFDGTGAYTALVVSARPIFLKDGKTGEQQPFLRLLVKPGKNGELNAIYSHVTDAAWIKFLSRLLTRHGCPTPATWAEVTPSTLRPLVGKVALIEQVRLEDDSVYHRLFDVMFESVDISDPERATYRTDLRHLFGRIEAVLPGKSEVKKTDQLEFFLTVPGYPTVRAYMTFKVGQNDEISRGILKEAGLDVASFAELDAEKLGTLRGKFAIVRREYSKDNGLKFHGVTEIITA